MRWIFDGDSGMYADTRRPQFRFVAWWQGYHIPAGWRADGWELVRGMNLLRLRRGP